MKTVAQIFAQTLEELGVSVVFGVPSGNWVDYMEALRHNGSVRFILVSNEAAASFMADVYWRCTGKVAGCFGTFGPGACNISTGVCTAYLDRSPLLVFCDEMQNGWRDRTVQMNIDQFAFFKPITKWQTRLETSCVAVTLRQAYETATSDVPGPVYVGIPRASGTLTAHSVPFHQAPTLHRNNSVLAIKPEALAQMHRQMQSAQKTIIVLGHLARNTAHIDQVIALAEKRTIPVICTPMAKGIISEESPVYAGVLAHACSDFVASLYRTADTVVSIGYDPVEFNYEDWLPINAALIHIASREADIDPAACTAIVSVTGDRDTVIRCWCEFMESDSKLCTGQWNASHLLTHQQKLFSQFSGNTTDTALLSACTVLSVLRNRMPRSGILCCDVGVHLHLIGQAWKAFHRHGIMITNGGSSMGFGLPSACAAALCFPEKTVACVIGDGGFLMMAGELLTCTRLKLKLICIVMVDDSLSLIRIKQERKAYPVYGTRLSDSAYPMPETLFGVRVLCADSTQQFTEALDQSIVSTASTVIMARIDTRDYDDLVLRSNK
ncbi:MAG: thiamine pyrophosphate-binding protein [Chitinivibrionales bacterium]|nr:thiamine pyrophosphate-binding protein [Chitinivibrionales bacterium]